MSSMPASMCLQVFGRQSFASLWAFFMESAGDIRESGCLGDGAQIVFQRAIFHSHLGANAGSQQSQFLQGFA